MAKDPPKHITSEFVKHTGVKPPQVMNDVDSEAIVMNGPMLDAFGGRWVCRVRFVNSGVETWVFADDLQNHERKPAEERK